ncbi:hypothetical protein H4R18_005581, partial [Coemansia javaensis]
DDEASGKDIPTMPIAMDVEYFGFGENEPDRQLVGVDAKSTVSSVYTRLREIVDAYFWSAGRNPPSFKIELYKGSKRVIKVEKSRGASLWRYIPYHGPKHEFAFRVTTLGLIDEEQEEEEEQEGEEEEEKQEEEEAGQDESETDF